MYTEEQILEVAPGIAADLRPSGCEDVEETENYAIAVTIAVFNKLKGTESIKHVPSDEEIFAMSQAIAKPYAERDYPIPQIAQFEFQAGANFAASFIKKAYVIDTQQTDLERYQIENLKDVRFKEIAEEQGKVYDLDNFSSLLNGTHTEDFDTNYVTRFI